jgi:hypothetical protein
MLLFTNYSSLSKLILLPIAGLESKRKFGYDFHHFNLQSINYTNSKGNHAKSQTGAANPPQFSEGASKGAHCKKSNESICQC